MTLTLGYHVDTGPASVTGLPDDIEDTAQIITNHEAVKAPTEVVPPEAEAPRVVVAGPKPPEKAGAARRAPGAFPNERPMIEQAGSPPPETENTPQDDDVQAEAADSKRPQDEHPLDRAARIRAQDQADHSSGSKATGQAHS
ncbi:hypothetical protein ACFWWM_43900 [Streptomyces sp. NPDC058682]|uniref:hypothetical protein n=1 Tax=Streptomyces sp. NPDC058682 TaxID=3346596 RepID=UPI003652A63F